VEIRGRGADFGRLSARTLVVVCVIGLLLPLFPPYQSYFVVFLLCVLAPLLRTRFFLRVRKHNSFFCNPLPLSFLQGGELLFLDVGLLSINRISRSPTLAPVAFKRLTIFFFLSFFFCEAPPNFDENSRPMVLHLLL